MQGITQNCSNLKHWTAVTLQFLVGLQPRSFGRSSHGWRVRFDWAVPLWGKAASASSQAGFPRMKSHPKDSTNYTDFHDLRLDSRVSLFRLQGANTTLRLRIWETFNKLKDKIMKDTPTHHCHDSVKSHREVFLFIFFPCICSEESLV